MSLHELPKKTSLGGDKLIEMTAATYGEFTRKISSAEEYLIKKGKKKGIANPTVWFRGHSKRLFALLPTFLRFQSNPKIEAGLLEEYRNRRPAGEEDSHINLASDWIALYEMQHYFIPTRLLDWTEDVDVAKFFAFSAQGCESPTVFLLSPNILNIKVKSELQKLNPPSEGDLGTDLFPEIPERPFPIHEHKYWDLTKYYLCPQIMMPFPIAILPPENQFRRIQAQKGRFTVHGSDSRPLESQFPEALIKVSLCTNEVPSVYLKEKALHKRHFVFFPDRNSLSMLLREEYGLTSSQASHRMILSTIERVWEHDAEALSNHKGLGEPAFIQGIQGCIVNNLYVDRIETGKLVEWVNNPDHPIKVVAGEAAGGKTNFLVNFFVKEALYKKHPVVFCSATSSILASGSLISGIAGFLKSIAPPDTPVMLDENVLREMVVQGKLILVLDGIDELSRTRGEEAIRDLGIQLHELTANNKFARIILGCRTHILNRLRSQNLLGGLLPADSDFITIRKLDEAKIEEHLCKKLKVNVAPAVIAKMAEIPLFYGALCRDPGQKAIELRAVRSELDFWKYWVGLSAQTDKTNAALQTLGLVAIRMLNKRSDYLDEASLGNMLKDVQKLGDRTNKWALFVCEYNKEWRFLHQAIREFCLAWNMKSGFERPFSDSVLTRTSSLDYENAETYVALKKILPGNSFDSIIKNLGTLSEQKFKGYDITMLNNFLRNYFEAIGMLGAKDPFVRKIAIKQATIILQSGTKYSKIRYLTRFNAARCLCRLHPTSPAIYCEYITKYNPKDISKGRLLVFGFAVRGFNKQQHVANDAPPEVYMRSPKPENDDKQQSKICEILFDTIYKLCKEVELHDHGVFVQINASHALLRWFDRTPDSIQKLLKLLKMDINWKIKANAILVLYIHCPEIAKKMKLKAMLQEDILPNCVRLKGEDLFNEWLQKIVFD